MRTHNRGVSLVELMVAVVLALITIVVVLQVLGIYEARKRTATGATDAEMSAAVGLYLLEREVRMAGAGLTLPAGFACGPGLNAFFGAATVSNGAPLAPLRIVDGGAGPDRLQVLRSDAAFGVAPATVIQNMGSADADVTVNANLGLVQGDLMLVGGPDGAKLCTLMQLSAAPQPTGSGWRLAHGSGGGFPYNPASPAAAFATPVQYEVGDIVVNLGQLGLRTYGVVCSDQVSGGPLAVPTATNSCDLASWNALAAPANPTLAQVDSIGSQVVNLQAQYGVAPANSQTVNEWVDATAPTWAAPTAANLARIKAVRFAIVTRGNWERDPENPNELVSPDTLVVWDEGQPTERTMALSDDDRRYRYHVLRVVVPLINVIWAGV